MATHAITGKLGSGKSLVAVGRIRDRLANGRPVSTNIDINLYRMFGAQAKTLRLLRVPDKPTVFDLECIGVGNTSYEEENNGLLTLDELGTWFNSRNWQDKSRGAVINWLLHSRKKGWDADFIVQDVSLMDSQARESVVEQTAFCRRLDRINIPLLSPLAKLLTGKPLKFPKVHIAKVVYGYSQGDFKVDRWVYQGKDLYNCYDTRQVFSDDYEHGVYSVLPPWYTHGRYQRPRDWRWYMRATKIWWKRFASPVALATGLLIGISASLLVVANNVEPIVNDVTVTPVAQAEVEYSEEQDPMHIRKLRGLVENLVITGSMSSGKGTEYMLANSQDSELRTVFTSSDLAMYGLPISPRGECRLDVKIGHDIYALFCLRRL